MVPKVRHQNLVLENPDHTCIYLFSVLLLFSDNFIYNLLHILRLINVLPHYLYLYMYLYVCKGFNQSVGLSESTMLPSQFCVFRVVDFKTDIGMILPATGVRQCSSFSQCQNILSFHSI